MERADLAASYRPFVTTPTSDRCFLSSGFMFASYSRRGSYSGYAENYSSGIYWTKIVFTKAKLEGLTEEFRRRVAALAAGKP